MAIVNSQSILDAIKESNNQNNENFKNLTEAIIKALQQKPNSFKKDEERLLNIINNDELFKTSEEQIYNQYEDFDNNYNYTNLTEVNEFREMGCNRLF